MGPVHDAGGRLAGGFVVGRDISDRKHIEEALRKNEELFRQLAENMREVFFTLDVDLLWRWRWPLLARRVHWHQEDRSHRHAGPALYQHIVRGAVRPDDADADASVHSADERLR